MIIGYARTSTVEHVSGFESQIMELQNAGCEKIFGEQVSSISIRTQLESAIEFVRDGDVFLVAKIDRLARSISDLMAIIKSLEKKRVGLRILNLEIDTSTPTGKLMLTVLGGIAQFEREIMLERQRKGVDKAKAEGKYKGRKPIAMDRQREVIRLVISGMSKANVAKQLGVGEASAYRILRRSTENSATGELQKVLTP